MAPDDLTIQEEVSQGIGGTATTFMVKEPLQIAFEEKASDRDLWSLHIEHKKSIAILPNSPVNLLGRDILNRFAMDYNPGDGEIELKRDNFGGGRYECLTVTEQLSEQIDDWLNG